MKTNTFQKDKILGLDMRIAVVRARFNENITNGLLAGCKRALHEAQVKEENILFVDVPGSFEIPLVASRVIQRQHPDVVIALGAVIRGETPHFDFVAKAVTEGVLRVSLDTQVPIIFGVITTNTLEQAQVRSRDDDGNKGYECAYAAVELVQVMKNFQA
ncbi:MAG: 6,7-dimethyl-8-ribityllumazine synthase [Parcubacteria group bacterium]|nr:6,7-dimethyl-8-ribityllumazine synthase [Parcubacteria group bacterium]